MTSVAMTLERAAAARGASLTALSRMIGRNAAYLQQFVRRGTPRVLAERDRRVLAAFLALPETALGADASDEVAVPYLTVQVSAGHGRRVDDETPIRLEHFSARMLRDAGVAPDDASIVAATGDSMLPTIADGDRLLVDRGERRVPRGGALCVVRRDGALLVKRVFAAASEIVLRSDNPAYPPITGAAHDIAVIGRVRLLLRSPV